MSTNKTKRRRPTLSRTGLLFVTHDTYVRRIWQHAYNVAVVDGKTAAEAIQIADEAKAAAEAIQIADEAKAAAEAIQIADEAKAVNDGTVQTA